jgi:hypothetical protein
MPYQHTSHDLTVGSNALVGRVFPHQLRYLCDVLGRFIYDGWLDQRSQFADSDAALLGLLFASESFFTLAEHHAYTDAMFRLVQRLHTGDIQLDSISNKEFTRGFNTICLFLSEVGFPTSDMFRN